jgi:hypothetical protein
MRGREIAAATATARVERGNALAACAGAGGKASHENTTENSAAKPARKRLRKTKTPTSKSCGLPHHGGAHGAAPSVELGAPPVRTTLGGTLQRNSSRGQVVRKNIFAMTIVFWHVRGSLRYSTLSQHFVDTRMLASLIRASKTLRDVLT